MFLFMLRHKGNSSTFYMHLIILYSLAGLRKMYSYNRNGRSSLHTIRDKDNSSSENKHNDGMFGLLATTIKQRCLPNYP